MFFLCPQALYRDFSAVLRMLTYEGSNNAVKPNMPVLFISGEMDPIGRVMELKK